MASKKKSNKLADAATQGSRRNGRNARDGAVPGNMAGAQGRGGSGSGAGVGPGGGPGGGSVGGSGGGPGGGGGGSSLGNNSNPVGGNPGGILAAVTKHAAVKFTADPSSTTSETSHVVAPPRPPPSPSVGSSAPFQSPLLKPESPSPPAINIPASEPVLEVASPTSYPASTVPSTAEWAKNVAGLSGSPGNLISIMSDSPPTQPSSYEDSRNNAGWTPPQRTYMNSPPVNHTPLSASPPTNQAIRRPLSFHLDGQQPYQPSPPDTYAKRRGSMHSQFSAHPRAASNPPPPHQAQAHFYGAPDVDFNLNPKAGMKAGDRGYHFGFDTLPTAGQYHLPGSDNVVLAGFEGGLDVMAVSRRNLDPPIASLRGLRGGVVHAKILPWAIPGSSVDAHVVVVIHGPVLPQHPPGGDPEVPERASTPANSVRDGAGRQGSNIDHYQTTVEVYSLKTGVCVGVLLEAPRVRLANPVPSPIFKAPPPTSAFQVRASDSTVVVASGQTGECWVYRHIVVGPEPQPHFFCMAKLWTCLQQTPKADTAGQETDPSPYSQPRHPTPHTPIIALNGRWLAYCPASPSSQMSLKAAVAVPVYGKGPGISSMTPPQLPSVNSELDVPEGSGVMNKILRETTQELIVGAKWVGHHGVRMWNDYWYKNPQQARSPPSAQPNAWVRQDSPQFPPTHGAPTPAPAVNKDPGLVSIVNTYTLGSSSAIHPIVTFTTQLGCSFLSFTPNGLALFTASTKGDVQTLWDLMRIQFTKSSPLQASLMTSFTGPRVRQIAQFSRMTVARIVDIAWTKPNGERLAVVTERGTVHIHDLPTSTFTWPPPRRRVPAADPSRASASEGSASATSAAVSIASSAFSTAASVARPLITRPRRSSMQTGGTSMGTPAGGQTGAASIASQGGRVIAASISSSLGKTGNAINQLRHTGENRVSLPSTAQAPSAACVTWISGRKYPTLFVLGDGIVRQFRGKSRKPNESTDKRRALRSGSFRDFSVPPLPDALLAPAVKRFMDPDEFLELDKDGEGGNTMVLDVRPRIRRYHVGVESSIPQAEIESSAPYQPFHTDRRVALYTYEARAQLGGVQEVTEEFGAMSLHAQPTGVPANKAWAFGEPIPSIKLDLGHGHIHEDEDLGDDAVDDPRALPQSAMERIMHVGENEEQIVVTTRRRRGAARSAALEGFGDDDGLFEDDCVVLDFADQRV